MGTIALYIPDPLLSMHTVVYEHRGIRGRWEKEEEEHNGGDSSSSSGGFESLPAARLPLE